MILQGGTIVTLSNKGIINDSIVVVENGYITEISSSKSYNGDYKGKDIIDCSGKLLLPSFCNAHVHSEYLFFKGMLEERRLSEWNNISFHDIGWDILEKPLNEELLEPAYRASYLEQSISGIGFIGEFNCASNSAILSEKILKEVGINGSASYKIGENLPTGYAIPLNILHNETKLTLEELSLNSSWMNDNKDSFITMHAAETIERCKISQEKFNMSTIRLLKSNGLLTNKMLLSHAVHIDEEEMVLISNANSSIISSPCAEMKLCDGIANIPAMLRLGINIALGTDCATCNNGVDMFQEMKTMGLLTKLMFGADVLSAETILHMATKNGMRAFGFHDRGILDVGYHADIQFIDMSALNFRPIINYRDLFSNIYANIVYCATPYNITDLYVNDNWIIKDKQHKTIDAKKVSQDFQKASDVFWNEVVNKI